MNLYSEDPPSRSSRRSLAVACSALLLLAAFTTSAATYTVTTNTDSGAGSLRAAIAAATNGDTIVFSLPSPSKITLTSGGLTLNQSLTISGPGPASLAIDGNATNKVFTLSNSVVISGLTITNGNTGLYCGVGSVTISNVVITGSTTIGIGSGIYGVGADLQIIDCTISSNSGGGVLMGGNLGHTLSMLNTLVSGNLNGGLYLYDGLSANLSGVTIIGNRSDAGAGIHNLTHNLTVNNSVISSNWASGQIPGAGGGIYNSGAITADNLTMIGNIASTAGGAIWDDGGFSTLSNSTLIGNSVYALSGGGAIANYGSFYGFGAGATLFNCVVSSNSAPSGGAIYNSGAGVITKVHNSTFSSNWATNSGGAIYNEIAGLGGYVEVVGSTFNGNMAPLGGAIYGTARVGITNSTFSANSAVTGGAIYNQSSTIYPNPVAYGTVQIVNSTFSDNTATNGGTLYNTNFGTEVSIGSSILNAGASGGTIMNNGGTIGSAGYNLCSDNGGGFLASTNDLINTDPLLGPLQDNGGPVLTMALLPGSPAINTGSNFSGFANDERGAGYARNFGTTDIGAFELQQNISPFANWQFRNFGCTNCPQADPAADPDGDGANNLSEFLAGTNPNSSASVFQILNITPLGGDLLVTWKTVGGHTNVVQASATLANSSFSDVSSNIVIPGSGDTTASFLMPGAATGAKSFYRVRLGP